MADKMTPKKHSHSKYVGPYPDHKRKAVIRAYRKLPEGERRVLYGRAKHVAGQVHNMGAISAIELLGKLSMFLTEQEEVSDG